MIQMSRCKAKNIKGSRWCHRCGKSKLMYSVTDATFHEITQQISLSL